MLRKKSRLFFHVVCIQIKIPYYFFGGVFKPSVSFQIKTKDDCIEQGDLKSGISLIAYSGQCLAKLK